MSNKPEILLIDDDAATNYVHAYMIKKNYPEFLVNAKNSAEKGLRYLSELQKTKHSAPKLILLDLNMPTMSGWDFLDAYKAQDLKKEGQNIVILTASSNPVDKERALGIDLVSEFMTKPMTLAKCKELLDRYLLKPAA